MAFHHVALATKDLAATHRFYTEAMGFSLAKVVASPTPEGGWARHVFYDTGDGFIAFWDLHVDALGDFGTDLNKSLGLPVWVNHLAFRADGMEDLERRREQWRRNGITVAQVDHGFCASIYATDPNGIMVEFCTDTTGLSAADAAEADRLLVMAVPDFEDAPGAEIFPAYEPAEV